MRQGQRQIRTILIAVVVLLGANLVVSFSPRSQASSGSPVTAANQGDYVSVTVTVNERNDNDVPTGWIVWRMSSDGAVEHRRVTKRDDKVSLETEWTSLP